MCVDFVGYPQGMQGQFSNQQGMYKHVVSLTYLCVLATIDTSHLPNLYLCHNHIMEHVIIIL